MSGIILIEDSRELAELLCAELEREGFKVTIAANGADGLLLTGSLSPDLIILDWMLPDLDGLEVLRHIRKLSPVPILMLTARIDEADRVAGLQAGADDYLCKPFHMNELLARVFALLRRIEHVQQILAADRQGDPQQCQYGRVILCPDTFSVQVNGEPVNLTRTEFSLLQLFMNNPGRVFNRTYLQETIWQQSYIPGDRSVDNAVTRLRKKLGEAGDAVEAVWGIGYRLKKLP
ncbi:MAG: response regulator transcription factor [Anaerolineae bacterium]|nr:response regulator transcription factor [Anaerolineae bacterium]